jgi:hemerythrin-like domain-containing protein
MDIISHLQREHDDIRNLLEQIDGADDTPDERGDLLAALREDLLTHIKGEEQTFYQEIAMRTGLKAIIEEARGEHTLVVELLDELHAIPMEDVDWKERFESLRETIEDHLEEEETSIFEEAREIFDEGDLERLFSRMRTAEERFRASL